MAFGLSLIFLSSCAQAILLGNYKLYDSRGSALYDFSGNRNHAEVSWASGSNPIVTDRGQYFYASSQIDFPTNMYKSYPSASTTMVIAMWLLSVSQGRLFRLSKIENGSVTNCYIDWLENNGGTAKLVLTGPAGSTEYVEPFKFSKINVAEWSFIILHITQGSSSTTVKIYDGSDKSEKISHTFNGFLFASADTMWGIKLKDSGGFQGFIYEIWWRDALLTNIKSTFSDIENAKPAVLTRAPQEDPFKTYNSITCSSSCTNNRNSCSGSASSCLTSCNISCSNGCYNFISPTCISPTTKYCLSFTSTNSCTLCRNNFTLTSSSCACSSTQDMISVMTVSKCIERVANCSEYSYFTEQCIKCNTGFAQVCIGSPCTNSCLWDCPAGYYKSSTSPVTCIACRPECSTCTGANTCTACVNTKYLKLASCLDSCGAGYFQNTIARTCIQCSANCYTCNYSGSILLCTTCNPGYYNKAGVCVLSCGVGYFQDNTARTCIECSANCDTCSYSADILVCTACSSGYYMEVGSCVATCSTGFYPNAVSSSCIQCPSSCSACTSDTECTSCKPGFALNTVDTVTTCDSCPVGQYGASDVCNACAEICTACTSISNCTTCIQDASVSDVNGFCECNMGFSYISGSCMQAFTASATMDVNGKINLIFSRDLITELNSNLLSFQSDSLTFDSSTFSMVSVIARRSYEITLNKVLLTGPDIMRLYFPTGLNILKSFDNESLATEYSDILIIASSITTGCSSISNCATCSISGASFICDSCSDLNCLYSDPSIKCDICCDDGYYKETLSSSNICSKCNPNCHTCSNGSSCLSCTGSFFLLNDDCVTECGVGKYEDLSSHLCYNCIENCDTCSDISSCTKCRSEFVYNTFINICEPCPEGTYYDTQACKTCPTLCRSCSSSVSCSECVENGSNLGGICRCDTKYTLINNECVRSSELHATAEMNAEGTILLSFDNELLEGLSYNSIALTIENISYNSTYFSISEIETQKVYTISLNLSLIGVSSLTLTFEEPSSIISVESARIEETSIPISVPFEMRCDSSNICELCPEICTECPDKQCTKCTNSYYLFNSTCVSDCPAGYYQDSFESKCIGCGVEDCISCEFNLEANSTVCLECSEDSIRIEIENIISCMKYSNSTELSHQICSECDTQCNQYKGQLECDICFENSSILSSECIINSIPQDIEFLSASLRYIEENMLMLSFEKPLLNDLTAKSILIHVNNRTHSPDEHEISKDQTSNRGYIIILENLDLYIDNTITLQFTNDTFPIYQSSYLSQVSVFIPAQAKNDLFEDSSITDSSYTDEDIAQAEQVQLIADAISTASTVVTAVSAASGNTNSWVFVSTIQIFSFMPLLQVDKPIILSSYLKGQVSYYPAYDLFKEAIDDNVKPYKKARDFKYQSSNFILNTGKPLFVLSLLIILNIISRISIRFLTGRLETIFKKINSFFMYGAYLTFFIQMYIELLVPALLQLLYVRII